MTSSQNGSVGIIVLIPFAIILAGFGGYYFATQDSNARISDSTEEKDDDPSDARKAYRHSTGVYAVNYPSTWKAGEGQTATMFTLPNEARITFELSASGQVERLREGKKATKIRFGSHTFERFTDSSATYLPYHLKLGEANGKEVYLSILAEDIFGSRQLNIEKEVTSLLTSIQIDLSKLPAVIRKISFIQDDANLKANVANFRVSAALYSDVQEGYSYEGVCDKGDGQSGMIKNEEILGSLHNIVSSTDIYCKDSAKEYILAVKLPGGGIYCVDSTGFYGSISLFPSSGLACK